MKEIRLAVRQLVEFLLRSGSIDSRFTGFDRANEGSRIHRKLQKEAGEGYQAEVFLSAKRTVEGIEYTIEGRADGIFSDSESGVVIDEIKTTAVPFDQIQEEMNPCHWAQGMIYGAIYAQQNGLESLSVRLTYYQIDEGKIRRYLRQYSYEELERFFSELLEQYLPWARRELDWAEQRRSSLEALSFPYPAYRPGQRALAGEIYRACRAGKEEGRKGGTRLFCQAPTGIGKTMSAIFPALKAMAQGQGDKIFYLTARTTTRAAAENAVALLRRSQPGLCLRSVTLTAKEKICLCKNQAGRPVCMPQTCPYANGYYDRIKNALAELLDQGCSYDRTILEQMAQKHTVCPFELALELSEWCDLVVGDYNHLFHPVVRLRRFFDGAGDWIFLIDEAHNLPDRAREMYSAYFLKSSFSAAKKALGPGRSRLKSALGAADRAMLAARRRCEELAPRRGQQAAPSPPDAVPDTEGPEQLTLESETAPVKSPSVSLTLPEPLYAQDGILFFAQLPEELLRPMQSLLPILQDWLEEHPEGAAHEAMLELYFSLHDLMRTAGQYDTHYVTQLCARGSELELRLLCLDPSAFVDSCLSAGRAAALFSATLAPPSYYREVLGCANARAVALQSPFPQKNLGLFCLPGISTRYRDREASIRPISDALAMLAGSRLGNYLAFFPSYAYLQKVHADFSERYPQIPTLVQESGMDEAGRDAFLARFTHSPDRTLLGFGVLGGVFGEGVDLTGDRLIGCAVIGVGLPQVNPRQEMLRRYYDEKNGEGFDYAYRCPGMNKVLQAAGRVIRTESDRGVVLLLDDRFLRGDYRRLYPPHWNHLTYLSDTEALQKKLEEFWAQPPALS